MPNSTRQKQNCRREITHLLAVLHWRLWTYEADEVDGLLEALEAGVEEGGGPLHVPAARRAGERDGRQTEGSGRDVHSADQELADLGARPPDLRLGTNQSLDTAQRSHSSQYKIQCVRG